MSIRGDKETVNSIDLIKYLLVEGRECAISCLNAEQNKIHSDEQVVWRYEDLLAAFNSVLDREVT